MQLQLTKQAEQELKVINQRIEDAGDEGYEDICESLNKQELLICDAGMYANSVYEDNEFNDLKEWCVKVGNMEYQQTYLNQNPNAVYNKVMSMLRNNIVELV
jgi:hypothetical protein